MNNPLIYRLLILVALVIMVFVGKSVVAYSAFVTIGAALAVFAMLITLLNPENGIILLTFSMLLSPEIELARIPGRSVTVRIDDFLLIAVFVGFVAYHAVTPLSRRLTRTSIDKPLILMVLIYFVSTGLGMIEGRLKPLTSFFFVMKYVEYFILFWMAANVTSSRETLRKIVIAGTITAVIVSIYAYTLFPTAERVYPPFDSEAGGITGESGTLGGYLMIVMSLALGFFANYDDRKVRFAALALFLFMLPPFIKTLSRSSYMALAAALPVLIVFSPKRKVQLGASAIAACIAIPLLFPVLSQALLARVQETFVGRNGVRVGYIDTRLEDSAAARVNAWRYAFNEWLPKRPVLGFGATGVGLVDTQYPRVLGEFGIVGFAAFLWLLFSIARQALAGLRTSTDPLELSLLSGFLAAFAGLLVQSLGVNTFIVVRIMTPFWLLCALISIMPLKSEALPGTAR